MALRVRIPELLEARGMTPYALAKASGGRISMSSAYKLARVRGKIARFDAPVIEALCDVLGVSVGRLFERAPDQAVRRKRRK